MADELFYSDAQTVIIYTGIRPPDLDLETEAELKETVEGYLKDAKELIDRNRNRDFHTESTETGEPIPRGIHNIAMRIGRNMIAQARLNRETAIVHNDEYSSRFEDDRILTPAIRKDLKMYPKKTSFGMFVSPRNGVE